MRIVKTVLILGLLILSIKLSGQSRDLDSLRMLLKSARHDTTRAHIFVTISQEIYAFYPDSLIPMCNQAIAIADNNLPKANETEKKSYYTSKALALSNVAFIQFNNGNKKPAVESWEKSLKIREEIKDKKGIASLLNNLGFVYSDDGDIPKALSYYMKSLKIREELKDKHGITNSMHNIAEIYSRNKDYDKALEYYTKNLAIQQEIEDEKGMAYSYLNIGWLYTDKLFMKERNTDTMTSYHIALEYFKKSMVLFEKVNYRQGLINALNNIGRMYELAGVPDCKGTPEECLEKNESAAMEVFQKSLKISEEIDNKDQIATTLNYIGNCYLRKNEPKKALEYAIKGMVYSKEIGAPDLIQRSAHLLYRIYEKQKDGMKALEMYKLYTQMYDSLNNTKNQKALVHSQLQYEFDKKAIADSLQLAKDKEVYTLQIKSDKTQKIYLYILIVLTLLSGVFIYARFRVSVKQKKEIEDQNKIISKSLTEKEVLLKEIHHRVKNNLQVISSILGLQSESIKDNTLKKVFSESKNKINTISLIHQKLYQSNDLQEIDMNDYFSSLYTYIFPLFENKQNTIVFKLNTSNIKFDVDTSVPLGLIFNELVTNALKYAFINNNKGIIEIELVKLQPGHYSFTIQDNGSGFSSDLKHTQTLGLNLVKMLTVQLNGQCIFSTQNGTKISIIFEDTHTRKMAE